ncbi:hypothetical protein ACHAXN_006305, partial [Cyclotella atomus]
MLNKNVTLLPSLVPLCKLLNLAQHPTPRASWMHQGGWNCYVYVCWRLLYWMRIGLRGLPVRTCCCRFRSISLKSDEEARSCGILRPTITCVVYKDNPQ